MLLRSVRCSPLRPYTISFYQWFVCNDSNVQCSSSDVLERCYLAVPSSCFSVFHSSIAIRIDIDIQWYICSTCFCLYSWMVNINLRIDHRHGDSKNLCKFLCKIIPRSRQYTHNHFNKNMNQSIFCIIYLALSSVWIRLNEILGISFSITFFAFSIYSSKTY